MNVVQKYRKKQLARNFYKPLPKDHPVVINRQIISELAAKRNWKKFEDLPVQLQNRLNRVIKKLKKKGIAGPYYITGSIARGTAVFSFDDPEIKIAMKELSGKLSEIELYVPRIDQKAIPEIKNVQFIFYSPENKIEFGWK